MAAKGDSTVQIVFDRPTTVYFAGERVTGAVHVFCKTQIAHGGMALLAEGTCALQLSPKTVGIFEAFYHIVKPIQLLNVSINLCGPGKFNTGKTEIPFAFELTPGGECGMCESYHGVFVHCSYTVSVDLQRGMLHKSQRETTPFYVLNPGQAYDLPKPPVTFILDPTKLRNVRRNAVGQVPEFFIRGHLDSPLCNIEEAFTGEVIIEKCDMPVKSVELQLVRVEFCAAAEGVAREATEIQNIQVAEGNVAAGLPIPIWMVFPRWFTCPTLVANNYKVEFEVNIVILLQDNHQITENFPIKLFRNPIGVPRVNMEGPPICYYNVDRQQQSTTEPASTSFTSGLSPVTSPSLTPLSPPSPTIFAEDLLPTPLPFNEDDPGYKVAVKGGTAEEILIQEELSVGELLEELFAGKFWKYCVTEAGLVNDKIVPFPPKSAVLYRVEDYDAIIPVHRTYICELIKEIESDEEAEDGVTNKKKRQRDKSEAATLDMIDEEDIVVEGTGLTIKPVPAATGLRGTTTTAYTQQPPPPQLIARVAPSTTGVGESRSTPPIGGGSPSPTSPSAAPAPQVARMPGLRIPKSQLRKAQQQQQQQQQKQETTPVASPPTSPLTGNSIPKPATFPQQQPDDKPPQEPCVPGPSRKNSAFKAPESNRNISDELGEKEKAPQPRGSSPTKKKGLFGRLASPRREKDKK